MSDPASTFREPMGAAKRRAAFRKYECCSVSSFAPGRQNPSQTGNSLSCRQYSVVKAKQSERDAMAFCELHYFSPALQKQTAANILLPEGEEATGPFCVFYLLHGLSDDHTIWQRRTSIERYVAGLPLIVVMPDGGRGFYTDAQEGMAYETAIVHDLVNYVDRMFPTKAERGGRCIGGLSMGGYGAIK